MTITKSVINENTRLRVIVSEKSEALREAQNKIDRAIEVLEDWHGDSGDKIDQALKLLKS